MDENELIEKYKMTKKEHQVVLQKLKEDLFTNKALQKNPSIMFVIGQPGCGKTTFIKNIDTSKYAIINSDVYRYLNKYSNEILEKYPTNYAKLTNFDAHLWGDELFNYAVENGYSVLREKVPTDYSLIELIKTIPNNFEIIINVVVAGNLSSLIGTRERYEKEILKSRNAKLSNIDSHNKCYDLLPTFISKCISLNIKVNYIISVDNKYKIVAIDNNYLNLLDKLRKDSNNYACLTYKERMNNIKKDMVDRNAPLEQFNELKKIDEIYLQLLNYNKK